MKEFPSDHQYVVFLVNGCDKDVWDAMVECVPLVIQGHEVPLDFHVMQALEK